MQGISGTNMKGAPAQIAVDSVNSNTAGGGEGGLLNAQKDRQTAATDTDYGAAWQNFQKVYGSKKEKPREIKKTLGKDDFLKIMITQMKNQDPSKPFDPAQMAQEIAQFTSVEQLSNMNASLTKMTTQNQPLERLAMTNMIGKTVTVDRGRFVHQENEISPLEFSLPKAASNVKVEILSETGESIFTTDLGPRREGIQALQWDGTKSGGGDVKPGNYMFRVIAQDESDRPIAVNMRGQEKVVGVSFEGNEGILLVGNPNAPQKIAMRNIVRVDTGVEGIVPGIQNMGVNSAQAAQAPRAISTQPQLLSGGKAPLGEKPLPKNFMPFGAGAQAAAEGQPPAALMQAAMKAVAGNNSGSVESANLSQGNNFSTENIEKNTQKGFPNGLSSDDN